MWYESRKPGERLRFLDTEKDRMYELLATALERCGGQAGYCAKIERELLSWYSLMLATFPTPATVSRYEERLNQASALVAKLGIKFLGEGVTSEKGLQRWSDCLARVTERKGVPQYSTNSITVKRPECPIAEYLPAVDATQGFATRQAGANSAWGVQWGYDEFIDRLESGKAYVVRIRAKPELKTTPAQGGMLFGLGH